MTYHFVSHTHWDREWYLPFERFRSMLVQMIDDVVALLESDPAFASFTLDGQTILLEDYFEVRPEMKARVTKLISAKRLFVGPWYVLPDEQLVSGEALVRNLLIGREIAREHGNCMNVGYIPDSFSHVAMMPAILRGFGIDNAIIYRGFGGEKGQETSEYRWRSPDGSEVLMVHLHKDGYSNGYYFGEAEQESIRRFSELKPHLDSRATTDHILVLNGGDHHWPDETLPLTLEKFATHFGDAFVHSNLPEFIDAVKINANDVPEIEGELRFGYRYAFAVQSGVYSSRMYIKQPNAQCENLLERYVEPLNAIAVSSGLPSQRHLIRHAWKRLLQNHPHDSICGCSADAVHREMMVRFEQVREIAAAVIDACMNPSPALRNAIQTDVNPSPAPRLFDGREIAPAKRNLPPLLKGRVGEGFVFNPSPFVRTALCEMTIRFPLQNVVVGLNPNVQKEKKRAPVDDFAIVDEDGNERQYQILDRKEDYDIAYSKHGYPKQTIADTFRVLVDVGEVPALSTKKFFIHERPPGTGMPDSPNEVNPARDSEKLQAKGSLTPSGMQPPLAEQLHVGRGFFANEFLFGTFNKHGTIYIYDKQTREKTGPFNIFEDGGDAGDEYNYSPPAHDRLILSDKPGIEVSILEHGPLRAAILVQRSLLVPCSLSEDRTERSHHTTPIRLSTIVSLDAYSRCVQFETTVENHAKDHRLRVLFETGIQSAHTCAATPFNLTTRTHQEYDVREFPYEHPATTAPMQGFVTIADDARAMTLMADGLPEYEHRPDGTIALTLLRCVGQLAGDDLITRPGGKSGWHTPTAEAQCQGTHTFRYAVFPHSSEEWDSFESVNEEIERFQFPILVSDPHPAPINPDAPLPNWERGGGEGPSPFLCLSPKQLKLSIIKEAEDGRGIIVRWWNPTNERVVSEVRTALPIQSAELVSLDEQKIQRLHPKRNAVIVGTMPNEIVSVRLLFKN